MNASPTRTPIDPIKATLETPRTRPSTSDDSHASLTEAAILLIEGTGEAALTQATEYAGAIAEEVAIESAALRESSERAVVRLQCKIAELEEILAELLAARKGAL